MRGAIIDVVPFFRVGDPAPSGYVEWHEWAKVQHRGGLRQEVSRKETCDCSLTPA